MAYVGLITKNTIEQYLSSLNIKEGKISYDQFKKFIEMIDTVLVDESGNILDIDERDKAVDLDSKSKPPSLTKEPSTAKETPKPKAASKSKPAPEKSESKKKASPPNNKTGDKPKRK